MMIRVATSSSKETARSFFEPATSWMPHRFRDYWNERLDWLSNNGYCCRKVITFGPDPKQYSLVLMLEDHAGVAFLLRFPEERHRSFADQPILEEMTP